MKDKEKEKQENRLESRKKDRPGNSREDGGKEKQGAATGKLESVKALIRSKKEQLREFRKKRWQKRYEKGEVDLPVYRVGPNKKGVTVLWVLMAASLAFGVYKNFTAIDKETIYQTTVVDAEVVDTNAVESFVERFAYVYHAWGNGQGDKSSRQTALGSYMTDELVSVNNNAVNSSCPTVSEVENVRICEVTDLGSGDYEIRYLVVQKFTETIDEESMASVVKNELPIVATGVDAAETDAADDTETEILFDGTRTGETAEDMEDEAVVTDDTEESATSQQGDEEQEARTGGQSDILSITTDGTTTITRRESFYMVVVHVDEAGCMVITKNPTACGVYEKSAYSPEQYQNDSSIDTATMADIQDFLNTFFNLYPTATEKELVYYASPGALDVINTDFVYDGMSGATYYKEDGQTKVHLYVRYLDQTAKMTQISEYTLTLEKGDNWKIVKAE